MLIKTHNSRLWGSPEFHPDYVGVTESGARVPGRPRHQGGRRRLPVGRGIQDARRAGAPRAARRRHDRHRRAEPARRRARHLRDVLPAAARSSAPTARRRASCCAGADVPMSALLDDSLVIVLAGGAGERLYPLTKDRAKPAVYFGGPYRIIDFALSNCINSGLRRIFIATQYKSLSLNRHIRMGWSIVSEELGEFVEILPPQKRVSEHWYQGTADAVYQNLYSIMRENPRHLDRAVGRSRLQDGLRAHAALPPGARRRGDAGDDRGADRRRAAASASSPSTSTSASPASRRSRSEPTPIPGSPDFALASMGVYIFDTDVLVRALEADADAADHPRLRQGHHPGADPPGAGLRVPLLRREQEGVEVLARHRHARRVLRSEHGSVPGEPGVQPVRSGVAAAHVSAAGAAGEVRLRRGRAAAAARRSTRSSRPAASSRAARISGSVLCPNVRVHSFCHIEQCILMPGVRVGRHARIRRAIIDRDVLDPARRAHRLQRRGGSPAPHRHRLGRRRRHDRRRAADRAAQRGGAALRGGGRPAAAAAA